MNAAKEVYKRTYVNRKKAGTREPGNENDWRHDKYPSFEQAYQNTRNTNNGRFNKNSRGGAYYQENMNWAHDKFVDLERDFVGKQNFKKKGRQNNNYANDSRKDGYNDYNDYEKNCDYEDENGNKPNAYYNDGYHQGSNFDGKSKKQIIDISLTNGSDNFTFTLNLPEVFFFYKLKK